MFTLPEVRGEGVAKALMQNGIRNAMREATVSGKMYLGSIVVDADNVPAVRLYKKFGFVVIKEEPRMVGSDRRALLMRYSPDAEASALIK